MDKKGQCKQHRKQGKHWIIIVIHVWKGESYSDNKQSGYGQMHDFLATENEASGAYPEERIDIPVANRLLPFKSRWLFVFWRLRFVYRFALMVFRKPVFCAEIEPAIGAFERQEGVLSASFTFHEHATECLIVAIVLLMRLHF